jgi:DnaJ domain
MTASHHSWARQDFYQALGVPPSATAADIKSAFRELAKQFHPDRFSTYTQQVWATQKMQRLNEAYSVLSDAEDRSAYDRIRASHINISASPKPSRTAAASNQKGKLADIFTNYVLWGLFAVWAITAFYVGISQWPTFKTTSLVVRLLLSGMMGVIGATMLFVMGLSILVGLFYLFGFVWIFIEQFNKSKVSYASQSAPHLLRDLCSMITMLLIGLSAVLPIVLDWPLPWLSDHSGIYRVIMWIHMAVHILSFFIIPFACTEILAILAHLTWSQPVFRRTKSLLALCEADSV